MRNALGVSVPPNQGGPPAVIIRDLDNPIAPVTVEHGAAPWGYDCGCMITPSSSLNDGFGALTWDPAAEQTRLTWDLANGNSARAAGEDTTRRMNEASAGVNGPLLGRTRPTTFHSLGGVALGRAADTFGRVDGYQGLYVVCGAALPGVTPTANPAWTIAANAERCLATIIAEDFA
jgi:cholesterol oxidase